MPNISIERQMEQIVERYNEYWDNEEIDVDLANEITQDAIFLNNRLKIAIKALKSIKSVDERTLEDDALAMRLLADEALDKLGAE